MSDAQAERIREFRALRDAAWAGVEADLAMLKNDLAARGIGERIKDRATEEAHEALDHAVDVASAHTGVVAATLRAVGAGFLRGALRSAFDALFGRDDDEEDAEQERHESVDADKGDAS